MSHEFQTEELFECDRCGALLPGDLMVWLDNGEVICEDCYEELCRENDEAYKLQFTIGYNEGQAE